MARRGASPVLIPLAERGGRAVAAVTAFIVAMTSGAGLFTRAALASDLPRVVVLPSAPISDVLRREVGQKTTDVPTNELRSSEQLQLVSYREPAQPAARGASPAAPKDAALFAEA